MNPAPSTPVGQLPELEFRREIPWVLLAEVALLVALAIVTRLPTLDKPPFVDELNHIFAARSLLERGVLEIVPGATYTRAWPFTYLVAGSFALFGDGLAQARLPALLAGAGLVAAVFLWVRREGGRLAGWTAALLLCFTPVTIDFSRMARFYTLHALVFWLGTVLVYRLIMAGRFDRWTLPRAVAAGACFALARRLHVISSIAVPVVGLWVLVARGRTAVRLIRRRREAQALALLALAIVCWFVISGVRTGRFEAYLGLFRYADLWAAADVRNRWYYYDYLLADWPTLWALLPVLAAVALWYRPAPALLCVVIFGVAFLVHSFAAWKNIRYLFYALPMLFALVGLAAGAIIPLLHRGLTGLLRRQVAALDRRPGIAAALSVAGLMAAAAFAAFGNPAVDKAWRELKGQVQDGERGWAAARKLAPVVDSSAVFIASAALEALYHFNRLDYGLLATDLQLLSGVQPEFSRSIVYGRPVVSTAQSLERIVGCYPSGLVLVEKYHWRKPWAVTPSAANFLIQHTDSLSLPSSWRMLAFRWRRGGGDRAADCPPPSEPAPSP
jgi:4-amino-4-deoxy-L-arabinose transferase-like glycosyltransferase